MNIIVITDYKKKLLTFFLVILLWILLIISAGIMFNKTAEYTVNINSNISFSYPPDLSIKNIYAQNSDSAPYIQASNSSYKKFIDFKSPEEGFEFSYPSIFKIDRQIFPGSEILYHIDLQNKQDKTYTGFVQVWHLPYSLEQFLESSKEAAMNEYINFSSKKIKVNNMDGYFWEYSMESATEKYKSLEVFLTKGSKFYRISYYMPEKKYTREDYDMFWKMVNSFKVK